MGLTRTRYVCVGYVPSGTVGVVLWEGTRLLLDLNERVVLNDEVVCMLHVLGCGLGDLDPPQHRFAVEMIRGEGERFIVAVIALEPHAVATILGMSIAVDAMTFGC